MALVQVKAGKADQAKALLKQAIETDPGYPPALYDMAILSRDTAQNPDEAGKYFRRYLNVAGSDPHTIDARHFLHIPEDSQKSPEKGIEPPPGGAKLGTITIGNGQRAESNPRTPARPSPAEPLLVAARNAIGKQVYDEALVMLNQAIKRDPANPDALWEMAVFYDQKLGYKASAEQIYNKFKQLFPEDPRAGERLNARSSSNPLLSFFRKDAGESSSNSDKAPSPSDIQAAKDAFLEGVKFQKAQDWDEAIRCYTRALERDRNFADASYNLGLAYKDNGNRDLAKDALLYTLTLKPNMTRAGYMLAIVYMETKDNEKAIDQLNQVLKLEPNNAKAHYLIGLAYRTELHFDEAKKHFERYIELEPHEPPAREAREWLESLNQHSGNR